MMHIVGSGFSYETAQQNICYSGLFTTAKSHVFEKYPDTLVKQPVQLFYNHKNVMHQFSFNNLNQPSQALISKSVGEFGAASICKFY